jgi:hypothetical protein
MWQRGRAAAEEQLLSACIPAWLTRPPFVIAMFFFFAFPAIIGFFFLLWLAR